MDRNVAMDRLKNCEQFKGLKPAELEELLSAAQKKQFATDDIIYKKGEPSNNRFGMIVSGGVKIVKKDGSVVRQMSGGQVIGEIAPAIPNHVLQNLRGFAAIFSNDDVKRRTATVIATQPTEVLEWDATHIQYKMPGVWKNLINLAETHLSNFYET